MDRPAARKWTGRSTGNTPRARPYTGRMLSATHPAASVFLYGIAIAVALLVALPLLVAPLAWARAIGWRLPEETELAIYWARCLGGVLLAVIAVTLRAAPHAEAHATLFHLIALMGAVMTAVHVVGALEGQQPWLETVEIVVYAGLTAAAWALSP